MVPSLVATKIDAQRVKQAVEPGAGAGIVAGKTVTWTLAAERGQRRQLWFRDARRLLAELETQSLRALIDTEE